MTNNEFIREFDLLYNNIDSNQAPGLNNYEKSVFLTQGQKDVLLSHLTKQTNKLLEGQDDSSRRQIEFSTLTKTITLQTLNILDKFTNNPNSNCFIFPQDIFSIQNEQLLVKDDTNTLKYLQVIPLTYNEYTRNMLKPYKQPLKEQAWRLFINNISEGPIIEVIPHSNENIEKYILRYIKIPHPIILEDLKGNNSIEGYTKESAGGEDILCTEDNSVILENGKRYLKKTLIYVGSELQDDQKTIKPIYRKNDFSIEAELGTTHTIPNKACELPEELHKEVLIRAVELAKAAYTGNLQEMIALSNASATQLGTGAVPSNKG